MSSTQVLSSKEDILVVDDAPENLKLLLDALTDQGYSVRCARSGRLAIASSQATPPDLVLLDILMPQMDGYEVCRQLKQNLKTYDIPVIFLSALVDSQAKAQAFALGGDDYIAKPFDMGEVLARIQHQLIVKHRQSRIRRRANKYRQASRDLRSTYTLLRDVLERLAPSIAPFHAIRDERGAIIDSSLDFTHAAFLELLRSDTETLVLEVKTLKEFVANFSDCDLFELCLEAVESNKSIKRDVLRYQQDEQQQWIDEIATKLRDGVVAALREINFSKAQVATLEAMKRELYTLATTDTLTQVGNRFRFDSYLEAEWQRSLREQQPLSLLMVDIDQFKGFNDTCGYAIGNQCLQTVAKVLQQAVKRPTDLVARYGGEEFVILLPNTPLQGAVQVADTIQTEIRRLRLPNVPSTECEQVCISLGLCCVIPQAEQQPEALIEAADRALCIAKSAGGDTNHVEML